jgi:long-chain-fatty-acid--CoA ligase ACSBG
MEPAQTATEPEQSTAGSEQTVTEPEQTSTEPEPLAEETPPEVKQPAAEQRVKSKPVRTKFRSTDPANGPDIAMGESGLSADAPMTIAEMFKMTVTQVPDRIALKYKSEDTWQEVTYQQYYDLTVAAAKSFLKLGLKPFHAVAIMGFNASEWHISCLGSIFAGGLSCGIYATNNAEACKYIAEDCKVAVAVVEDQKQLDKFLKIRDELPELKAIVQYKGELSQDYPDVYTWEQFMELGKDMDSSVVDDIIKNQKPNQCASLVYTSGTTGNPKGTMLSHDNLTWTAKSLISTYNELVFGTDRFVSYLPLSHIAGQVADIYLAVSVGATCVFADPDALKGSLVATLKEAQPTLFFGVPRVYEKIMDKMQEAGASLTGLKRKLSVWAKKKGLQGNQNIQKNQSVPWGWSAANMLILKRVREALGFQQCNVFAVGAAPIKMETMEYFMSVNIPLMNVYGMSESSGPHTVCRMSPNRWNSASAGKDMDGVRTKILDPDADGEGEICFYGRHVFMGYLNNEEKTMESIDDEGWLHSGDIGRIDENGFLHITGRIKEIIITSGGENIPPVLLESNILREIPFLSNVMVVGDKRKYLTCLMTLKCEVDQTTEEPQDTLTPLAKTAIEQLGSRCTTVSEIIDSKDRAVFSAISEGLERANKYAISNAQKVQKWSLLDADFSIPGGELGPTLKLRRFFVVKKYAATINAMYEE